MRATQFWCTGKIGSPGPFEPGDDDPVLADTLLWITHQAVSGAFE
jgi:hypothetical protein